MAYAAALAAGLAAFWLCLAPEPFDQGWLIAGAIATVLILLFAWRARLIDREGAPYFRAPSLAAFFLSRIGAVAAGSFDLLRAVVGADMKLHPALVRMKTRRGHDPARAAFANAVTLSPGQAVVDCDEDSILIHALVEDDADDRALREVERAAWAAFGRREEGRREQQQPAQEQRA